MRNTKKLSVERPDLLKEWDYEKNAALCLPEDASVGSHKKVHWRCAKGHEWISEIRLRVKGSECPYCSGKKVLSGFNDFGTKHPELLKEWDYSKNSIDPFSVSQFNHAVVWWKCSACGHELQASIGNRSSGSGCPVCARKRNALTLQQASHENSIAFLFPELLKEWDYDKNVVDPSKVNRGSTKKYWWKCSKCNQSYQASVGNRANGSGCPICAGKQIVPGINDLQTWCKNNNREDILEAWDYEKNGITPEQVAPFSGRKVFYICKEGHSYQSTVANKIASFYGCPICNRRNRTSFPEQTIFYYIKTVFSSAVNSYHASWLGKQELDIYIPETKTAIEYDGIRWHKGKSKHDAEKNALCSKNEISLIRIRENGLNAVKGSKCFFVDPHKIESLHEAVKDLLGTLGKENIDINIHRDTYKIIELFDNTKKVNSLSTLYPGLVDEWDYEKNGSITPEMVNYGSERKFWWKCKECGNSYLMSPNYRTYQKQGCPNCADKKKSKSLINYLVKTRGSFESTNSPLLNEWDYENNTRERSNVADTN